MELNESNNLSLGVKSLENLLELVKHTQKSHHDYLTKNSQKQNKTCILSDEIKQEISQCQKKCDEVFGNNLKMVPNNSNIYRLQYKIRDIQQTVTNQMVKIQSDKHDVQNLVAKFGNVKFYQPQKYSICQFDLKYTKLSNESTIDCDNKHIKIGSTDGHCYSMILPGKEHVRGYKSGQHCFRMYYKNPYGQIHWLFFGIYQYGIVPKAVNTYAHEASWGIADNEWGQIYCNGKQENDKSNMPFLYSLNENEIDMLIDFDKGILSYAIVDDNVKNRKYTLKKKFDASISYNVHLNFYWSGTQVQIAKVDVDMFGENKKLVT